MFIGNFPIKPVKKERRTGRHGHIRAYMAAGDAHRGEATWLRRPEDGSAVALWVTRGRSFAPMWDGTAAL